MFAYCTEILHLSEHEAYLRITVARAAREHALILTMLSDGRLHLSAIAKVAPHLTEENHATVLARAVHRSKREIEEIVAELVPRPDVRTSIRRLPEPMAPEPAVPRVDSVPDAVVVEPGELDLHRVALAAPAERPLPPAVLEPLSPTRYRVQFTASAAFREKLERLQRLMQASVPDGDLVRILESAVSEKLARLEARRFGMTNSPKTTPPKTDDLPSSRHIPAAVRRAVHRRDLGRCRYVDGKGIRCRARDRLEFHHVHPWALGGNSSVENVRLMCRAHNARLAEHDYGERLMSQYRRPRASPLPPP